MEEINIRRWFNLSLDFKYIIVLILAALHSEGKISDEKLKGQFNALRKGTLQKRKRTHHCDINDQWYNDEPTSEIWSDLLSMTTQKIDFGTFLKYLKMFENIGRNHALNVFGNIYLYGLFKAWNPGYFNSLSFYEFTEFAIHGIDVKEERHTCYECGNTHFTYDKDEKNNVKVINEWIHMRKKGNLSKIPKFDVSSRRTNIGMVADIKNSG